MSVLGRLDDVSSGRSDLADAATLHAGMQARAALACGLSTPQAIVCRRYQQMLCLKQIGALHTDVASVQGLRKLL